MFNLKKKNFITFSIIFLLSASMPAYAYAGPGAAIGVIIVFLTVVFAFFGSVFISIFQFLRNSFKKFKFFLAKKKQEKKSSKP